MKWFNRLRRNIRSFICAMKGHTRVSFIEINDRGAEEHGPSCLTCNLEKMKTLGVRRGETPAERPFYVDPYEKKE